LVEFILIVVFIYSDAFFLKPPFLPPPIITWTRPAPRWVGCLSLKRN